MLFCFVLVLVQPHPTRFPHTPAASTQSVAATPPLAQAELPNLTFAPATPLPALSASPASSETTAVSSSTAPVTPAGDSKMLQAASANNQHAGMPQQPTIIQSKLLPASTPARNTEKSQQKNQSTNSNSKKNH